ncbi:ABC transporter ATP-binding protein [Paenibacillus hamazuiensis]|uniref:ABC transporter ATP-binding protein n=1 Tax=Paenibacillus hamazuiensis TaxID=2936508 RepID=UPI002010698F|nr:ABC transporter ATP-binding protein [Paenibacillus hamazuiensis]
MEPILQVSQLTKKYRNGRGIEGIGFEVRRGDIYGLFGPNGAGKTTVLKTIAGLCPADRGEVRLFGLDPHERFEQAMERVGIVVEGAEVYAHLTAYQNLRLILRLHPALPPSRIDEVLEWVGLEPFRHEPAGVYSLGMKQRLALAAALLPGPELVILDEPTNGLDIEGTVGMRNLIVRLAGEQGTTFLLSSHMLQEMERICTRYGIMAGGRMIREGEMSPSRHAGAETGIASGFEQIYMSAVQQGKEGDHAETVRQHG